MWNKLDSIISKKTKLCLTLLTLLILMLVLNMSAKFWREDCENMHLIIDKLSPFPQNQMLDFEATLCPSKNIGIKLQPHNNIHCPQKPIVTVQLAGRLGNQMYEYISVWAIAKKTGHKPYVPRCLIQELEKIFDNITIPPLSYLAYWAVVEYPVSVTAEKLDHFNGSILLPVYAQLPKYIAPLVSEIRQVFTFKEHILNESQRHLHNASRGVKNITFVGVHVRRTDYKYHLKVLYNTSIVKPDFFHRQMNIFRHKYKSVMFVVLSDDPEWCERKLRGGDVVVMRNNSPVQDLAIMAACNHSIIDYGTYGMWGAILAGGDTFVYNLTNSYDAAFEMALLLPNWHIVT